jgi:putative transcriptional regulator
MKDELFAVLVASVKEGGAILRGEKEAARTFHLNRLDIKRIREEYKLIQAQFAARLGISVRTLRNWEQGRRGYCSPGQATTRLVARHRVRS